MSLEIERKFLVSENYKEAISGAERVEIIQAYLSTDADCTVRVRVADEKAYLTIKTRNKGAVRNEWEYEIPVSEAVEMADRCNSGKLSKTRYFVPLDGRIWEIDVFHGHLEGLVVAEVELKDADEIIVLPSFVRKEITDDSRYYNSCLIVSKTIPEEY